MIARWRWTAVVIGILVGAGCSSSGTPSGKSCPSLDAYCGTHCVRDWATAQQPSTWCTTDAGTANNESVIIRTDCDGLNFVYLVGTDNGTYYYYDPQSGQLVGVGSAVGSNTGNFCLAGVAPSPSPSVQCGDGGATPVCGPGRS
jgi:hypothetical protein